MNKPKIVVFTGAGISAESGIKTFRDNNGLWENHQVSEVATPEAWNKNPALVLLENGRDLEGKYLHYYRKAIQFEVEDNISYEQFWKPLSNAEALKGIEKIYL